MNIPFFKPKRPTTERKVAVKPSFRPSTGSIVEPYEMRHKVRVELSETVPEKQHTPEVALQAHKVLSNKTPVDSHGVLQVTPQSAPVPIGEVGPGGHTSGTYSVVDDYGRTGFFKPANEEVWGVKLDRPYTKEGKKIDLQPYRIGIVDDRLKDREVLASDISKLFGMDTIPDTQFARVQHGDKDLGEGSIQMDAKDFLSHKGFKDAMTVHEAFAPDRMQSLERHVNAYETAFENGGIDLAFFDLIIGNCDRHRNNFFIGVKSDPAKGESYKMAGIDHGLSFPNSDKLYWKDILGTKNSLWTPASVHGIDTECSKEFKHAMMSEETGVHLQKMLLASKLTGPEQHGVMHRFGKVSEACKRNNGLRGEHLGSLVKEMTDNRIL